jgi:hypothetical protein
VTTRVGIVEWARRITAAIAAERALADALGRRAAAGGDVPARLALVRAAREHGRHAELWKTVLPVLHDVDPAPDEGLTADAADDGSDVPLATRLEDAYRAWAAEATPVAEGPIARVLASVRADHESPRPPPATP